MRFKINRILKNIPIIFSIWNFYLKIVDFLYYKKHCRDYTIISLGTYCLPRVITTLSRLKPRKFFGEKTCFFDLCFSLDFESNIKLLDNEFKDFFEGVEYLKYSDMWVNKEYNVIFNLEHKGSIEKVKKNYEPRIKNLFECIKNKSKHLYFIVALSSAIEERVTLHKEKKTKIDDEKIQKLMNVLYKYRNADEFEVIIINQTKNKFKTKLNNVHVVDLTDDEDFSVINSKGDWVNELKKQKTKEAKRFYTNLSKQLKDIIQPKTKFEDVTRISLNLLIFKLKFQNPLYLRKVRNINKKYEIKNSKEQVPIVVSKEQTIEELINSNKSLARFGDGEFELIKGTNLGFQNASIEISSKLQKILKERNENLLVGIPDIFSSLAKYNANHLNYWRKYIARKRNELYSILNLSKTYYDSFVSRPYMGYKDKKNTDKYYQNIKKIWENKDIVIVEGEFSRMGVANDLYTNAKSIKRILCPSKNAYLKYSEILNYCMTLSKDTLFILALGPTATILAYDLFKNGYRALDLGNLDIEYEWYKMKAKKKVAIKGKFVWEAKNGQEIDEIKDFEYQNQIVAKFVLEEKEN